MQRALQRKGMQREAGGGAATSNLANGELICKLFHPHTHPQPTYPHTYPHTHTLNQTPSHSHTHIHTRTPTQ